MIQPGYSLQLTENTIFEIRQSDITRFACDAIVNAANSRLKHFGGLAAAIVLAGGHVIQEESDIWETQKGAISFDRCAVTSAGNLPCKWVIHAVGPQWGEGDEEKKLVRTFTSALVAADSLQVRQLAVPPVSTGIFGVPKQIAASALRKALAFYFNQINCSINLVSLVIIDEETYLAFLNHFKV